MEAVGLGPGHRRPVPWSTVSDTPGPGPTSDASGLTVLGGTVRHAIDHLECFPAPNGVSEVRLRTDEVVSVCPVTGQPDLSSLEITYQPHEHCIESKSLKLYLWKFRDRAVFAEALAAEIAHEVQDRIAPRWVRVTVRQGARGGISLTATSELGTP